jgi:hypothetical protein
MAESIRLDQRRSDERSDTTLNRRLLAASILLFIRGGMTAIPGALLLLGAAFFYITNPRGPNEDPLVYGVLMTLVVGGLALSGVAGLAIGIPSVIFAVLIQTRKWWAQWAALVGESLIALFFVVAAVWGLTHPADRVIAAPAAVALVVLSAPVLLVLVPGLTARRT